MGFFSFLKRKKNSGVLVAVQLCRDGVAIASTKQQVSQTVLSKAKFCSLDNPLSATESLEKTIKELGLSGSSASLLLSADEYQILLVESPDVPDDEMKEALVWRVKDMIHYSVDDVVIDYVELPEDAFRGRGKMIYVVVAQKSLVMQRVAWLESIGLVPEAIDIPELALLNLTGTVSEAEAGTAILYLQQQNSLLSMLSGSNLYMSRSLSFDPNTETDSTLLDLQRSMDYFESQIGKPPCVKILVMPLQMGETPLMMALRQNLSAEVESLDLGEIINSDQPLNIDVQQRCSLAICAAFRQSALL